MIKTIATWLTTAKHQARCSKQHGLLGINSTYSSINHRWLRLRPTQLKQQYLKVNAEYLAYYAPTTEAYHAHNATNHQNQFRQYAESPTDQNHNMN